MTEVASGSAIWIDSDRIVSNRGCLCKKGLQGCHKVSFGRASCVIEGQCETQDGGQNFIDYCDDKPYLRSQLKVQLQCYCFYGGEYANRKERLSINVGELDSPAVKDMRSAKIAKDKCAQHCCDASRNSPRWPDLQDNPYQGVAWAMFTIEHITGDHKFDASYFFNNGVLQENDICPEDERWTEDHPRACAWPSRCDSYHGHKLKDHHIDNCVPHTHSTAKLTLSAGDWMAVWGKAVAGAGLSVVKAVLEEAMSPFAGIGGRPHGSSSRGGWSKADLAFAAKAMNAGW